jgi:hypothetical protein
MIKKKLVQILLPLLKEVIILLLEEVKDWLEEEFNKNDDEQVENQK